MTWEEWKATTERFVANNDWEGCLRHVGDKRLIEKDDDRYVQLQERVYKKIEGLPAYQQDVRMLRGLAYIYCREAGKSKTCLSMDKKRCEAEGDAYFTRLLQQCRRPYDVYSYAQFLYKKACNFFSTDSIVVKSEMKEKAYELYHEAILELEKQAYDRQRSLYSRACYGFSRCGLDMLAHPSILQEELAILFNEPIALYGQRDVYEKRLKHVHACLDTVRKLEALPSQAADMTGISMAPKKYANSWDIYYLLGKAFDYAWHLQLCQKEELAYELAEKYYGYACQIDYSRKKNGKRSIFSHMYIALIALYIRRKDKEKCLSLWKTYDIGRLIPKGYQTLTAIRWAIVDKDYEKAKQLISAYKAGKRWEKGLSEKRVAVLSDIIQAAQCGRVDAVEAYSPYQQKMLAQVTKLAAAQA